jgi:hypothetical protein
VAAYWTIGLHLGVPVPQNLSGELLTDIRDTGANPDDPSTRLYKTRAEQDFHTDGADIAPLLFENFYWHYFEPHMPEHGSGASGLTPRALPTGGRHAGAGFSGAPT